VERFFLPVEGLTVTDQWRVGDVTLYPVQAAKEAIEPWRPDDASGDVLEYWDRHVNDLLDHCVAEVSAESYEAAVRSLSLSIDLLRVFQQNQTLVQTTHFGLPGEIRFASMPYLRAGALPGSGSSRQTHHPGYTFTVKSLQAWNESAAFQFASAALRDQSTEASRRTVIGTELLSRAILANDDAMRMLLVVMALEAMLIEKKAELKRYAFAQRVAFLNCGRPTGNLCGRSRETCTYLATPPIRSNQPALDRLSDRATEDLWWKCTEWTDALEWYKTRNAIAHGATLEVPEKMASRALYWTLHHILVAVLELFAQHPEAPIDALRSAIAELPEPPDWEAMAAEDAAPT